MGYIAMSGSFCGDDCAASGIICEHCRYNPSCRRKTESRQSAASHVDNVAPQARGHFPFLAFRPIIERCAGGTRFSAPSRRSTRRQ
jgi:hypothetical protein